MFAGDHDDHDDHHSTPWVFQQFRIFQAAQKWWTKQSVMPWSWPRSAWVTLVLDATGTHESPLVNPREVEGFTPIRIQQATAAICSNWGEATHDSLLICQMVIGNPRPISAFPHRFLLLKIESIESSIYISIWFGFPINTHILDLPWSNPMENPMNPKNIAWCFYPVSPCQPPLVCGFNPSEKY